MLSSSYLYFLPHVVWSAMSSGECRGGIRPYSRTSAPQANLQTGMVKTISLYAVTVTVNHFDEFVVMKPMDPALHCALYECLALLPV